MSEVDWSTLPSVVLIDLYGLLSAHDRISASSTCKHWREAFYFYPSKRKLHLNTAHYYEEKNSFLIEKFSKICQSVAITFVLTDFEEVVELMKSWTFGRKIAQFQMVGACYHFSPRFTFEFDAVYSFLENCTELSTLVLSHFSKPASLANVLSKNAASLTKLALGACPSYEDGNRIISVDLLEGFNNLTVLQLNGSWLSEEALELLGGLKHLRKFIIFLQSNNHVSKIPAVAWSNFHERRPNCGIRITYYRMETSDDDRKAGYPHILYKALNITHIRLFYCSNRFHEVCMNVMMKVRPLLHTISSIWAIFDPEVKHEFSHHPYVVCAWRYKHLKEMVLSGSYFDEYDLAGMARMRPGLMVHIAKEDIYVTGRRITNAELEKLIPAMKTSSSDSWSPMDVKRFNDPTLPPLDRESVALKQIYLADFPM